MTYRDLPTQYTKPEIRLFQALSRAKVRFLTQVPIKTGGVTYLADFLILPRSLKLVVEVDGAHWHDRTEGQRRKGEDRTEALTDLGYTVLRFDSEEVMRSPSDAVEEVVREIERLNKELTSCGVKML